MSLTGAGLNSMRSIPTFGTVGAIAEIVDNSIQWKTEKDVEINIIFIQKNKILDEILIIDNGQGMGKDSKGQEIIDYALYFGGGTNHGAKKGLGKYGIGLPYACCSQATEYHIYTWQEKNKIKHISRDHSKLKSDEPVIDVPHEVEKNFPKYFDNYLPQLRSYNSGTIVHWKNCDRLTYKRANTIITHLEKKLGKIYRHFIGNGISINFKAFNQPEGNYPSIIEDLCNPIKKFDPLFIDTGTIAEIYNDGVPSSIVFRPTFDEVFTDSKGEKHNFTIRTSIAKNEVQFPNGNRGGQTNLGALYGLVQGISLVRANRELRIHHFDFNFHNGSSDPRHRWYKIEVLFEPKSDELLGVNANKTDALNFRYIRDEEQEDQSIDYIKLRYQLSAMIQNILNDLWDEIKNRVNINQEKKKNKLQKCPTCKQITIKNGKCMDTSCDTTVSKCQVKGHENIDLIDGKCPACTNVEVERFCTIHNEAFDENGFCPSCEKTDSLTDDEVGELVDTLENYREFNGDKKSIKSLIKWFEKSGKKQFLVFISNPMNLSSLFEIQNISNKFDVILVNKCHPFYTDHIGPLKELIDSGENSLNVNLQYDFEKALDSLVLFIITWAHTERSSTSDQIKIKRFRNRFGIDLCEKLETWNELLN